MLQTKAVFHRKDTEIKTKDCVIDKVIHLSDSEFDRFSKNLMREWDFIKNNFISTVIIRLLLPFKYPTISDTLNFGRILTSIWMWSGQHSASIISIPFLSHNSRNIFPVSCLSCPYTTVLLYFGSHTMWYLHSHLK